jgi:hypothetical protein
MKPCVVRAGHFRWKAPEKQAIVPEGRAPGGGSTAQEVFMADDKEKSEGGIDDVLAELRQIRATLEAAREQQSRYLWILFPIGAIVLVQTILFATKL